jgi:diguanylate cyclase (GGDEF)-like protein
LEVSESTIRDVFATQEMLRVASLDSNPGDDDGETDLDRIDAADFCPDQLSVEDRVVLEAAIAQLRELEQKVLTGFHLEARTQTEIAAELGISCNYVSHILKQSLGKLRRILSNEEVSDRLLHSSLNLSQNAEVDEVTGIYSATYFEKRVTEEVHRACAENGVLGLMLVNFEGTDKLQEFYGRESIRDLLIDVGEFLKQNVRRLDIVCRWETTGFGIILPATGSTISTVETRIRKKFVDWLRSRTLPSGPIQILTGSTFAPDFGRFYRDLVNAVSLSPILTEKDERKVA